MLAIDYYVKNRDNQTFGEIRISVAPAKHNSNNGFIELTYTDYKAGTKTTNRYNSDIYNAL